MSIFPLFLLLGVVYTRHVGYYDNGAVLQPIVNKSQERRICAELCMSGLGGDPCGEMCVDLTPQILPSQSKNELLPGTYNKTRSSACPTLCKNKLGYPLCDCDTRQIPEKRRTDFVEVCGYYCLSFNYQIFGCQACDVYKNATAIYKTSEKMTGLKPTRIDWNLWCKNMCLAGEGGAACNCDLLPMSGSP